MKLLTKRKDGGGESTVTGYWLIEIKSLFSIALLRFDGKSREAYHEHAFNCVSWVLKGGLRETFKDHSHTRWHFASWKPFVTRRHDFHKVDSIAGTSLILTFRGPWAKTWWEDRPNDRQMVKLTHGREEVAWINY